MDKTILHNMMEVGGHIVRDVTEHCEAAASEAFSEICPNQDKDLFLQVMRTRLEKRILKDIYIAEQIIKDKENG